MNKFLVPIDFSETSVNAARYAVDLVKEKDESEVIFYHVYNHISVASLGPKDEGSRQKVTEHALTGLKQELDPENALGISIVVEDGSFVDNIRDFVLGNKITMIIMGITGSSRLKQVFMGTNTLNVVRSVTCPVLIIPSLAKYKTPEKIAFTSDFKDVARTTPFRAIKKVLKYFGAQLDIINVDEEHYVDVSEAYKIEKQSMQMGLAEFNPNFSFIKLYDFVDGINTYVENHNVDIVMTLPRKQGFISQLFVTSHTKELAYNSNVPILAMPTFEF